MDLTTTAWDCENVSLRAAGSQALDALQVQRRDLPLWIAVALIDFQSNEFPAEYDTDDLSAMYLPHQAEPLRFAGVTPSGCGDLPNLSWLRLAGQAGF